MSLQPCSAEQYLLESSTNRTHRSGRSTPLAIMGKGLLDIPPEVRLMVYSYLETGVVHQVIRVEKDELHHHITADPETRTLASLSRSCRVIHREINDKLYEGLWVTINVVPDLRDPRDGERATRVLDCLSLLPRHLRHIRDIHMWINLQQADRQPEKGIAVVRSAKSFLAVLRRSDKLQGFDPVLETGLYRYPGMRHLALKYMNNGEYELGKEFDRAQCLISQLEQGLAEIVDQANDEDSWLNDMEGGQPIGTVKYSH